MFLSKKELTIEVAEVDGVHVHDVDFAEAREDEILEEFTSNSSSTDQQGT